MNISRRWWIACCLPLSWLTCDFKSHAMAETLAQRTLVIVHTAELRDTAAAWADYRTSRGWTVDRYEIESASGSEQQQADRVRSQVLEGLRSRFTAASQQSQGFAALLLGDDDAIPAWRFEQHDPLIMDDDGQYVSDMPYQLADDADAAPDFALGRVPARSNEQAMNLLEKIRRNESLVNSAPAASRITYVAGEGRFGPMDALIETLFVMMVDRFVPAAFDMTMTYAKANSVYCPPPSKLKETVISRLLEGSALFNYVGHGFEHGFDSLHWNGKRLPMLRTRDLDDIDDSAPSKLRPMAFFSCCSVGRFDLPKGEPCFSEALLFHPAGPIAIISGSRITHPYPNTILQKDITHAFLIDRAATAGELDLQADRSLLRNDPDDREIDALAQLLARQMNWESTLKELRLMHARMYNLLGDPATELALAPTGIEGLALTSGTLTGRAAGFSSGTVTVRIETPRAISAHADELLPVDGNEDPALDRKAEHNYPRANDLTLVEVQGELRGDRFEIALPDPLPNAASVIRVHVTGTLESGVKSRVIGALAVSDS